MKMIHNSDFIVHNLIFIGIQPHSFTYVLSVAVFALIQQCWVVTAQTGPQSLKYFLCDPFCLLTFALEQVFSNFSVYQHKLEGSLNHRLLGPSLVVSDSEGLRWVLRICIPNKFPDDPPAASWDLHF